jgi:hypothetical protein
MSHTRTHIRLAAAIALAVPATGVALAVPVTTVTAEAPASTAAAAPYVNSNDALEQQRARDERANAGSPLTKRRLTYDNDARTGKAVTYAFGVLGAVALVALW